MTAALLGVGEYSFLIISFVGAAHFLIDHFGDGLLLSVSGIFPQIIEAFDLQLTNF